MGGEMSLGEDSVPIPTNLLTSVLTVQTQKSQSVLSTLLGGSKLEGCNVLGCDVDFHVTLITLKTPLPTSST